MISIRRAELTEPDVARLISALNAELAAMYPEPGANHFGLQADELAPGKGAFLVASVDGVAVGCGAIRTVEDPVDPTRVAGEIKRMFADRSVRGRGVGRAVLTGLEDVARELGLPRLILETGTRQAEAIALYRRGGFVDIPLWGEYLDSAATSVCLGKTL